MNTETNSLWGALGFLTQEKETVAIETPAPAQDRSEATLRLTQARNLAHNEYGYKEAFELGCWLSKSKKGGAILIEEMDTVYMANAIRMIKERRHPVLKPDSYLGAKWISALQKALKDREKSDDE